MSKKVVCFGEVLWDILPTQKVAGWAPMNVAIRLESLGISTQIISKIGKDAPGEELLATIQSKNVGVSLVQQDEHISTGEVLVKLDENGIATYDIVYPSAWDKIEISEQNIQAVKKSDVFVFGSLASRDEVSRNTLFCLLELARYKVFDVNIRKPYFDISLLERLMIKADFIKFNDVKLNEIAFMLGSNIKDMTENIRFISEKTNTNSISVTLGKDGAVLFIDNQFYINNGYKK
jgi:fructokinase